MNLSFLPGLAQLCGGVFLGYFIKPAVLSRASNSVLSNPGCQIYGLAKGEEASY